MAVEIVKLDTAFLRTAAISKRRPRERAEGHLRFVASLQCVVTGRRDVQAAHVRYGHAGYYKRSTGAGEKPDDKWAVPLCVAEHARQHSMDEEAYWQSVGIDPLAVAQQLWAHSGDERIGEEIVRDARAGARPIPQEASE